MLLLVISISTFIVLATVVLLIWVGLVIRFSGHSRTKKNTRPTPTVMSFFQPTAGKIAIDVPIPMANYKRSELLPLLRNGQPAVSEATLEAQTGNSSSLDPEPQEAPPSELDDPTFAPADSDELRQSGMANVDPPVPGHPNIPTLPADAIAPAPTGFNLSLDRHLLSRLLNDDSLCQEFEKARDLTLDRQRDTGRSYASLFREAIDDKPTDVQAILLNLLDEEEVNDFDAAYTTFS